MLCLNKMSKLCPGLSAALALFLAGSFAFAATTQEKYYAHSAVEDKHGVIAPWYKGQNGQCDFRVRIAAETLKRYPWADASRAVSPAPEYVYRGAWKISDDGTITIPASKKSWMNGDLGQRASYVLGSLIDYYRYSGDPAAIAHITVQADALLNHCLTPDDHPWPNFLISVPVAGKIYGPCDPHGYIQLDIVAEVGLELVRAYQLTGNIRWFDAAKHWGDLFAGKRNREPGMPPWNRYANPENVKWNDRQTGGVSLILAFLDELIRAGYPGPDDSIVKARDAGRAYLSDVLLPKWTVNDTWGRHYWDWDARVQGEIVTEGVAKYLMANPDYFTNWRVDARNIISLFLNHTSIDVKSNGDVYHGAWAYPESSSCCGRSLWYAPLQIGHLFAQYGVLADNEWGRELARRQVIMATYDCHETGVVEDNIDGGQIVAGDWFKIAHPMALKHVLAFMSWLPDVLGANRENHIMRSTSVVSSVAYRKGKVTYSTSNAPENTVTVLRLAYVPKSVYTYQRRRTRPLKLRPELQEAGYSFKELPGGDCLVSIRHDGMTRITIEGDDPQEEAGRDQLTYSGNWGESGQSSQAGGVEVSSESGAAMGYTFTGNQVRLVGSVGLAGGLADVYVDGVKQLVGIDCWNPFPRHSQVLYYKNGLENKEHTLRIVVRGEKNPLSQGTDVFIGAVQYSLATGDSGFGEGGGPTEAQRVILGYTDREDYVDSAGNAWQPGMELVTRGAGKDTVASFWWTSRRRLAIAGTDDPELYRYGVHGQKFSVPFTVAPGTYHVRVKLADAPDLRPKKRVMSIHINGKEMVKDVDVAATAGKRNKAVDLVFNGIQPKNGVIDIRFTGSDKGEAIVQAIEVAPGDGGEGAKPVSSPKKP